MVLHPFLFAAIPILYLYAFNIGQASFADALIPLLVSLAVTAVVFFTLKAILKNKDEAGMLVSLALIVFYSYGHVRNAVSGVSLLSKVPIWLPLYAVIFVVGVWLVARYKDGLIKPTKIVNVVAVALLVMSLFNIALNKAKGQLSSPALENRNLVASAVWDEKNLPDIYYIVVDSFASESSLKEYYGYDDSGFVNFLEKKGFYVAENSRSNYMETFLSLASSLNMTYVNFLSKKPGESSSDRGLPYLMLRKNEVARRLKTIGYTYLLFSSGWGGWRGGTNADVTLTKSNFLNNEFISVLMRTTILRKFASPGLTTREGVRYTFSEIPKAANRSSGPDFVVAHVMPPHHPFLFTSDGGATKDSDPGSKKAKEEAYVEQVQYVSKKLEEMVGTIQAKSGRRSVIIIQADHGPSYVGSASTTEEMPSKDALDERTSILNAYYLPLPDGKTGKLYGDISPVNSFREVFNLYFKAGYKKLSDLTYYSTYKYPYKFTNVTEEIK